MSKNKTVRTDPTMPPTEIVLDGRTYKLCFDFASLADAESHFISRGHQINMLAALPVMNLSSIRIIFPCALHKYHPDIKFEEAQALVTLSNVFQITSVIAEAWEKSLPEKDASEGNAEAAE